MRKPAILVTEADMVRLHALLAAQHREGDDRDQEHIEALRAELAAAAIIESNEVPADIVTLNSRVGVRDLERDTHALYTLVPPVDADAAAGRLSVLAPLGTAILGRRAGDEIHLRSPTGLRRLRLERLLYQPEAARRLQGNVQLRELAAGGAGR
ncbi:MAG: GreA/GreB family elongation factor [Gammaproteobacteria bacterium]|nr:GreA/GreB family elongation factor [Gammaproteobacteria bacterium]